MNFAIILRRDTEGATEKHFARLKIPPAIKRFIKLEDDVLQHR